MSLAPIFDILLITALLLVSWRLLGNSDLFQAAVLFISFGLFLSLAWVRLQAPDIALAEAAVGAGLTGALLFATLKIVEPKQGRSKNGAQPKSCRLDRAAECPGRMHYILASIFVLGLAGLLLTAVFSLPDTANGLAGLTSGFLAQSGVEHPVTAVLLNFRLYDTWLELGVLLLALLGVLGGQDRLGPQNVTAVQPPNPVLFWLVRILAPVMVLATVYLLWLGDHAPGGAFQAGVVLAATLVLLWLAGLGSVANLPRHAWLLCLIAGFGAMLLLALFTALATNAVALAYPQGWAKALILLLESLTTISIGVILASLAMLVLAGGDGANGAGTAGTEGKNGM